MSSVSHKLTVSTHIGRVCDSSASRYALGHVQVRPRSAKGAWLAATDGRIVAIVPDEHAKVKETVLMPAEIAAGVTKSRAITAELNGRWENSKGKFAPAADPEGRFPQCDKCLSDVPEGCIAVRFDAKLLAKLADALTAPGEIQGITMFIPTEEREIDKGYAKFGFRVVGALGIGIIMPLAGEDKAELESDRFNAMTANYAKDAK
jgi:hypothetical protein